MIVMDPLSDRLACACVQGHAQRKYDQLARFLERRLKQRVKVIYGEDLAAALREAGGRAEIIVGKQSVLECDLAELKLKARPSLRLTDKTGSTDLVGLFVVRKDDPAHSLKELTGRKILFGPTWAVEKHAAALEALRDAGVVPAAPVSTVGSCTAGAVAVAAGEADAAVISSYAYPLLEGCKTVERGALRTIGQTKPVPFVTVFVTDDLGEATAEKVRAALLAVGSDARLLVALESKAGFVPIGTASAPPVGHAWTDWRGPQRAGFSPDVPDRLPVPLPVLWRRPLTGNALAGVAATQKYVVVADKDASSEHDIFRCLTAESGAPVWVLEYAAAGEMDFTNSPRAAPVIADDRVYLLGALGHLHCVTLESGQVLWKKNLIEEFHAPLPKWGLCSTPLLVDDLLIVNPGAADAALVALDRRTGVVRWKTPGNPAAYASFIIGTFGGVRQIVGYDAESLGGWDPQTGRRLWTLTPNAVDFNVPTPIAVGGRLLVSTENNGTRLYDFDQRGALRSPPVAQNLNLKPDASTPVVTNGLVFGVSRGLYCLDLADGLRARWRADDDAFDDYASLIAGPEQVLILTTHGELLLIRASAAKYEVVARVRLFDSGDIWAHPALVGARLYVRHSSEIVCFAVQPGYGQGS